MALSIVIYKFSEKNDNNAYHIMQVALMLNKKRSTNLPLRIGYQYFSFLLTRISVI